MASKKTPFELAAERRQEATAKLAEAMNKFNREQHELYSDSDLESAIGDE